MERPEFLSRYIRPFYMDLMKMNFIEKPEADTHKMVKQLKELSNELSDAQLKDMLNDAWRLSKVGAWMIGLGKRTNLKTELESYLHTTPSDYCEHVLMNLYILDQEKAGNKISEFLERQIRYYNTNEENIDIENLSIQWAVGLLKYSDKINDSKYFPNAKSNDYWKLFLNKIEKRTNEEQIRELISSEYYINTIEETIKRLMITSGDDIIG
jgi:hypothetical protein